MLYKIRYNPVHPLNGTLPGPYVPVRFTHCALVAHWYTYALPCCRISQYSSTFLFPSRCPSGPILLTLYSMLWAFCVSRAGPMLFYWPKMLYPYYSLLYYFSLFILPVYTLVLWGWGLWTDRVYITLSQPCTADLIF